VKLPFVSACLNHGKKEPNPRVEYRMVKVADYTDDPVLQELISMVGSGRLHQRSAQAAIWTRTDGMSWQQLAGKSVRGIRGFRKYFAPAEISRGQMILTVAETRAREVDEQPEAEVQSEGRVR